MPIARRRDQSKYPQLWDGLAGAWYPGAGPSGNTLYDLSGRDNHGTLTNGPTWVDGQGGKAISFDGSDDYVTVGDVASLKITGAITLSVWVKRGATLGTVQGVVSKGGGGGFAPYVLVWNSDNGMYFLQSMAGGGWETIILSSTKITDTNWHHIAATSDLTTAKLYIDFVNVNLDTSPASSLWETTRPVLIGAEHNGSVANRFNSGQINDVRIYNRALHVDEIKLLAQRPGIAYEPKRRVFYSIPSSVKAWLFRRQSQIIGGGLG